VSGRATTKPRTFARLLWLALRRDLALGLPFVPIYSLAEVVIAQATGGLLQLIFIDTPRVSVASLVPEALRGILRFGQTLDRKDLAFAVPIVIIAAGVVKLVTGFLTSYLIERAGHRAAHAARAQLLGAFLSARGNTLDALHVDELANRVLMDTTLLQSAVSKGTVGVIRDGCLLIFLFVAMFLTAFKAMLVIMFVIVPTALVLREVSKALTFYAQGSAARQVSLATRILQTWNGRLTVHALRAQERERAGVGEKIDEMRTFMRKSFLVRTGFGPLSEVFVISILAALLWWKFNATQSINPATITTVFVLIALSFRPLKQLAGVISLYTDVRAVYLRLSDLWDTLSRSAATDVRSHGTREALVVRDLTFEAKDGRILLDRCSLTVPYGASVALVGESGAGKTTFLRAAAGLLVPKSGRIESDPRALLATQHPYVFKGTVKENVLYSLTHNEEGVAEGSAVEEDRLRGLLLRLHLAHSAMGAQVLSEKNVGFLGEGLSGGEKARVALARLLFTEPRVLLLDEPTANLDARSARAFWEAVDEWKARDPQNTVVAVSHALHEVKDFDRIYVFQEGRIAREGTPAEIFA